VGERVDECRGCRGFIVWASTAAGKAMPLDAQASYTYRAGDWVIEGPNCRPALPLLDAGPFHRPHWIDCPQAERFRGEDPTKLRRVNVARFGKG
jgi:hypothetical protein